MPVLKKNKHRFTCRKIIQYLCLAVLVCVYSGPCRAKAIEIHSTHIYSEDEIYYLNAKFEITLTDEARLALSHGIPLEIYIQFQLLLDRKWLWDKTLNEIKLIYRIKHQPLTEDYLVLEPVTGQKRIYDNLAAAINHIGTVTKINVSGTNRLNKENTYSARIRAYLDLESLPSPMRPQAYFSSNWDISSEWYQWRIDR